MLAAQVRVSGWEQVSVEKGQTRHAEPHVPSATCMEHKSSTRARPCSLYCSAGSNRMTPRCGKTCSQQPQAGCWTLRCTHPGRLILPTASSSSSNPPNVTSTPQDRLWKRECRADAPGVRESLTPLKLRLNNRLAFQMNCHMSHLNCHSRLNNESLRDSA